MSAPIITAPIITSALIPNIQFLQENTYSWVPNKRGVKINGGWWSQRFLLNLINGGSK